MNIRKESNARPTRQTANHSPHPDANVESDSGTGRVATTQTITRFDSPVRVRVFHYRYRFADPDGLSVKAALDAFVRGGILRDDSAKEIKEITHEQIQIYKPEKETTVFEFEAVKDD